MSVHQGVVCAYGSGALSVIIMRYAANVVHPTFGHAVLALFAVAGILAAYLLIAGSNLAPGQKAANIIGVAVVAGICPAIASFLA
jgi:hypothetical protein